MNFKDNLKKIRKDNNLSQEELAEKLNVTRQSVSKWESGQAYPEMDKVLQICKMFNLNIDDLLNKDIKEVNEVKESKYNINKYIDDFLGYVTKTVNVYSSMKLKDRLKCLFEQALLIIIFALIFLIIGSIGDHLVDGIFGYLPSSIYNVIYNIIESIYFIVSIIVSVILLTHIFKVRYLDYYELVDDGDIIEENVGVEEKTKEDKKIVHLKKDKERIVIRDPKHTGYGFINGLAKCILFIIKFFALWIVLCFAITLISLVMLIIISFMFTKAGLLFLGVLLILLSSVAINIIILDILYNFIMSKKSNGKILSITFLISLIGIGIGSGLLFVGMKDFNIILNDDIHYMNKIVNIDMQDDLIFDEQYFYGIHYVEEERNDIEIVITHTKYTDMDIVKTNNHIAFAVYYDDDVMSMLRDNINDINNKEFIDYNKLDVTIYASKDNLNKLMNNYDNQYKTNNFGRRYYEE